MMREEQVTKYILKWLINRGWEIVCFDFPQSGTGRFLHPNDSSQKNRGAINPDIVAVKDGKCVFFENKDRFYSSDFEKINDLITGNAYSKAINNLLSTYSVNEFYYGIGLPKIKYSKSAEKKSNLVDFIIGVEENGSIIELYRDKKKQYPFE